MHGWFKRLSVGLVAGGAVIALTAGPAAATDGTNPNTGCIGGNNMMGHPGMDHWAYQYFVQGHGAPSLNGMIAGMANSDTQFPTVMCG